MKQPQYLILLLTAFAFTCAQTKMAHLQLQVAIKQQKIIPYTFSAEVVDQKMVSSLQNSKLRAQEKKQIQIEPELTQNRKQRFLVQHSLIRAQEAQSLSFAERSDKQLKIQLSGQIDVKSQNNGLQTSIKQVFNCSIPHLTQQILQKTNNFKIKGQHHQFLPQISQQPRMLQYNIQSQPVLGFAIDNSQRLNAMRWREIVEQDFEEISLKMVQQYDYYENKYKISSYEELPFCIVVPTFNNEDNQRYLRNIRSIVMQNYSNYHIVIIDDGSTDQTGQLIVQYLTQQTSISKYTYQYIRNQQPKKAMYNLRKAALQYCQPHQIFLIVDGDDQLVGKQVLKLFNSVFQKTGSWFVYSNFIMKNGGSIGYSRPFPRQTIQSNNYRNYPFVTSHLRAFYTKLFVNVKQEDLKDESGNYFKAANDVAICIPVLEQAYKRVSYLPELTYYYNSNTGQNNHIVRAMEQRNNDRKVRRKKSYKALKDLFDNE